MSTFVSFAGLQNAMLREGRLADEPLGPELPTTDEDFRAFYEAADVSEGDEIEWDDGVTSEVVAIVPALSSEVPWTEVLHIRTVEPDGSVNDSAMPDDYLGECLTRGIGVMSP